jgi:hypothetical protein
MADWIDNLPAWMAPDVFRGEVLSQYVLTVFAGSTILERQWTASTVGQSMFPQNVIEKRRALALIHAVVSQPSGLISEVSYSSNAEDTIRTQAVVLPLQVLPGAVPHIVGYMADLTPRRSTRYIVGNAHDPRIVWLDIGSGTPSAQAIENAYASIAAHREGRSAG